MKKGVLVGLFILVGLLSAFIPVTSSGPQTRDTTRLRSDTLQLDRETNLVIDDRLTLVKAHCTSCHSSKLILQSHLTRDGWRQKIRWMQRTQKLWDLGESEPVVLDYLVKYYGPEDRSFDGRRLPLPKQKWE